MIPIHIFYSDKIKDLRELKDYQTNYMSQVYRKRNEMCHSHYKVNIERKIHFNAVNVRSPSTGQSAKKGSGFIHFTSSVVFLRHVLTISITTHQRVANVKCVEMRFFLLCRVCLT